MKSNKLNPVGTISAKNENVEKSLKINSVEILNLSDDDFDKFLKQNSEKIAKENEIKNINQRKADLYKLPKTLTNRNLRKGIDNLCNEILLSPTKEILKINIKNFDEFYKKHYTYNDYSINSIMQGNTGIERKEKIVNALNIIKRFKSLK